MTTCERDLLSWQMALEEGESFAFCLASGRLSGVNVMYDTRKEGWG